MPPFYLITFLQCTTLRLRQNGWHLPDDSFKCMSLNEKVWILIKISLKFVPWGPINNIPTLVHIMTWCRVGTKSLCEPMMVSLLMHICVTPPQRGTPVLQRTPYILRYCSGQLDLLEIHTWVIGCSRVWLGRTTHCKGPWRPITK